MSRPAFTMKGNVFQIFFMLLPQLFIISKIFVRIIISKIYLIRVIPMEKNN